MRKTPSRKPYNHNRFITFILTKNPNALPIVKPFGFFIYGGPKEIRSIAVWPGPYPASNSPSDCCILIIRISSVNTIPTKKPPLSEWLFVGGPEEIRTPDPYNANVMRSQLRYGPVCFVLYAVWGGLSRIKCDRETWRGLPQNERKMRKFFVSFFRNIRLKRCFAVWYNTKY